MAQDDFKLNMSTTQQGTSAPSGQMPASLSSIDDNDPFSDVKKEMRTRFELLPEDIKAVILSSEYEMKLFNMAKTHKLTYEELGTLELETTMMLLGMTRAKEFRDELQIELKKNDGEIDALVNDLNKEIFLSIRQSLERIENAQKDPEDYMSVAPESAPASVVPKTPAVSLSSHSPAAPIDFGRQSNTLVQNKPALPLSGMSTLEHSEFAKEGIEIGTMGRPAESVPPIISAPLQKDSEIMRTDLLRNIENPARTPNIVTDKLMQGGQTLPPKTTDYSMPKVTGIPQPPKTSDPYREPIE